MPYKDPAKAKERSRRRASYFREYHRKRREMGLEGNTHRTSYGTSIGFMGEELALKVLMGSKRLYRPADLKWEGKIVEVKTAIKQKGHFQQWTTKEYLRSSTYRWKFFLKQLRQVDLFFIICEDREKKVEHIFLIPDKDIKRKNLSISESSIPKYDKYRLTLQ